MDEVLEFSHSPHVTGLGVMHAHYTERKWHLVNAAFGLAVPSTWVGELAYRGRRQVFRAGEVFCTEPGEVHETSRILQPGAFKVVVIDEAPLVAYLAEIAPHLKVAHFRNIGQRMSPGLVRQTDAAFRMIGPDATPLQAQSCAVELVAQMAFELLDDPRPARVKLGSARAVERARECLHEADDGWVDLDTLSGEAGISRFHLLRSFKQKYGLPPHAYQIGLRLGKAQRLLRRGVPVAQVAVECGFTDQSHLSRHFKKTLGVTPGRFARDVSR
jgi:AraC-like DNA-binding protein